MNRDKIKKDEIDSREIVEHLKKNIKTILLITFLITTIAIIYAYFVEPIYSSSVSISFSDKKMSKLTSIIPDELSSLNGDKGSELETIKLTIQTKKFISSVVKEMSISQRYYIEENLKKIELYGFENLDIDLKINDKNYISNRGEALYGKFFKIEPISNKGYRLSCDSLGYSETHLYNKLVVNKSFSIKVSKKGELKESAYFIKKYNKKSIANYILQNLTVDILSDNVLRITFNDTVSRRAKEVVEAIAKKFIAYTLEKKTNKISQTLKFLDEQIAQIKVNLESKGDKLKGYQEKSDAFMPLESSRLLITNISNKKEELKVLEFQYAEVKKFKKALSKNQLNTVSLLNSGIDTSSIQNLVELFRQEVSSLYEMNLQANNIEKAIVDNEQLEMLINQLNKKKILLVGLNSKYTEVHPEVIQTKDEIALLERKIRDYILTDIKKLKINRELTKNKILNNIKMTESSLKRKIGVLKRDIREQQKKLKSLPEKNLATQDLKRKFTLSENIYTLLLEKKMELKISKASTIANTQIIEDATDSGNPVKPNRKLIVAIGAILGLIFGILFTVIRSMFDTKIRDVETVKSLTNIPIQGTLPKNDNILFFKEALRNIRTNLCFSSLHEKRKSLTILISSMVANEGKTTVVAGLGEIIAQANKRVLVIDLDLRKPRLYQEMKKSNKIGVTDYLLEEDITVEELVQPIDDNLDFIAAGSVPSNPSELLSSYRLNELINKIKEKYDCILLDTAPIGTVVDTSLILKYANITLLVIRANKTEKSYLESFNKLIQDKGIKSAGIILNQVELIQNKDYGYRYGDTQHKGA